MVVAYAISIGSVSNKTATLLASESDLSTFSFFQRSSVSEFLNFFSKTVIERTPPGQRAKVEQDAYVGYVYVTAQGLATVLVTDNLYPSRVAFSLLNRISDEFLAKFPQNSWSKLNNSNQWTELKDLLRKAQNPESNDPFMKVQRELDETKVILHKTMASLLERGEKLDDLVAKSDELSAQSKMFYKTAKKTNACCVISNLYLIIDLSLIEEFSIRRMTK